MKIPSVDDMHLAAQWLDVYEGAEDAEACKRVSEWLRTQADAKELRDTAREAGVPVGALRSRLKQMNPPAPAQNTEQP